MTYTVQIQYTVDEDIQIEASSPEEAIEIAENMELPNWCIEWTLDIRAVFDEDWIQYFDILT